MEEKYVSLDKKTTEKLGELLIKVGALGETQLKQALEFQKDEGGLLGEILVKLGYVNEKEIIQALTEQYGVPYLPLGNYDFPKDIKKLIPENVARQYSLVPIGVTGDILTVSMSNPLNVNAVDDIEMMSKKTVKIFISSVSEIHESIKKIYKKDSS